MVPLSLFDKLHQSPGHLLRWLVGSMVGELVVELLLVHGRPDQSSHIRHGFFFGVFRAVILEGVEEGRMGTNRHLELHVVG